MVDTSEKFPVSFESLKDSWDWLAYSETLFLQHFWYNLDGGEDLLVCLESEDERYLKFKARALKWANSGVE